MYASELLATLLQMSDLAKRKLTEKVDGIDMLLRVRIVTSFFLFFKLPHFILHTRGFKILFLRLNFEIFDSIVVAQSISIKRNSLNLA